MKKLLYINTMIGVIFLLSSCDPDATDFQSVDLASITDFYNEVSGNAEAFASGLPNNSYTYTLEPRSGSTYAWSITGFEATITPDAANPFIASYVFDQSASDVAGAEVSVTETTSWGASKTFTFPVSLKAYCAYDVTKITGALAGDDEGYVNEAVFTFVDANTIKVTGLGVGWMTDFWGEVVITMEEVTLKVDDLGLNVTLESQAYMTTTYNGADQDPYTIAGSGVIDGCSNTMTIRYGLTNYGIDWGTRYSAAGDYFEAVITLP